MKTIFFFILSLYLLASCNSDHLDLSSHPAIYGLAYPVYLNNDTTKIFWCNYVTNPKKVRDVVVAGNLSLVQDDEGESCYLLTTPESSPLGNISFRYKGHSYDIPILKKTAIVPGGEDFVITTDRLRGDTVYLKSNRQVANWGAYVQNYKLKSKFIQPMGKQVGIIIPGEVAKLQHSLLRVWACDGGGVSNEVFIPLEKGKVITRAIHLERFDKHATVAYSLVIDRFNRVNNASDTTAFNCERGKNIGGVTEKLKEGYFERLGVNSIWLSPAMSTPESEGNNLQDTVKKQAGYFKNWFSLLSVDAEKELEELIEEAHKRDISVVWDSGFGYMDREGISRAVDSSNMGTLFFPFGRDPKNVVESVTDSVLYWLANYELDGFRYSTICDVPLVFWQKLDQKLKRDMLLPENKSIYQVAGAFTDCPTGISSVEYGWWDGSVDNAVYRNVTETFVLPGQGFAQLNSSLQETFHHYGRHNKMIYVSGDRDRSRFISYAAGDASLNLKARGNNWKTEEQKPSDPIAYQRLVQLLTFNATIPGIPMIYYGDEMGMPGSTWSVNSQMMRFDGLDENEQMVLQKSSALNYLRCNHIALIYGDFIPLRVENLVYAYVRYYFGKEVIVVFNKGNEDITLHLELPVQYSSDKFKSLFEGRFSCHNSSLIVDVPANGAEVIYN